MKKTEWFPGDVKPVHVGYYEHQYDTHARYVDRYYWNGAMWLHDKGGTPAFHQSVRKWRGLAEQPK